LPYGKGASCEDLKVSFPKFFSRQNQEKIKAETAGNIYAVKRLLKIKTYKMDI